MHWLEVSQQEAPYASAIFHKAPTRSIMSLSFILYHIRKVNHYTVKYLKHHGVYTVPRIKAVKMQPTHLPFKPEMIW